MIKPTISNPSKSSRLTNRELGEIQESAVIKPQCMRCTKVRGRGVTIYKAPFGVEMCGQCLRLFGYFPGDFRLARPKKGPVPGAIEAGGSLVAGRRVTYTSPSLSRRTQTPKCLVDGCENNRRERRALCGDCYDTLSPDKKSVLCNAAKNADHQTVRLIVRTISIRRRLTALIGG